MEISKVYEAKSLMIYSDRCKVSQYFLPKLWIKWHGKERIIKMKTLLGDILYVKEDNLRKINLKITKILFGKKYIKLMTYNKPRRQCNRIPLLAISKKLQKRIGRLSVDVKKEYEQRARNYPGWTGRKVT